MIINTHLDADGTGQSVQLAELYWPRSGLCVLAGDLNLAPDHPAIADLVKIGWTYGPATITWASYDDWLYRSLYAVTAAKLDYVLVRGQSS